MPKPNPEQTASIFSTLVFSFLDPVVWEGYRTPHLKLDQLPPLVDSDHMKNLAKRTFPVRFGCYLIAFSARALRLFLQYLDPMNKSASRHVLWGLMRIYSA